MTDRQPIIRQLLLRRGWESGRGQFFPSPKFLGFQKIVGCFMSENFRLSMENCGLKKFILWKFTGKVGILRTHNLRCQKFATASRNYVGNLLCVSENCNFLTPLSFVTVKSTDFTPWSIKT